MIDAVGDAAGCERKEPSSSLGKLSAGRPSSLAPPLSQAGCGQCGGQAVESSTRQLLNAALKKMAALLNSFLSNKNFTGPGT